MDRESERDFVHGPPPMSYTYTTFTADIANGNYELTFAMVDRSHNPEDYGPMWIVANGTDSTGHFMVPAGQSVKKTMATMVVDEKLNVVLNSAPDAKWLVNSLVVTETGPAIMHVPTRKIPFKDDILIRATVTGPEPITSVRLWFGTDKRGYLSVPMEQTRQHLYVTTIPKSAIEDKLRYFIEAADQTGRRTTFPREGRISPILVMVSSDNQPPTVSHIPVTSCAVGKPLALTAEVNDPFGVKWVRLRYRGVNQHQDFRTLQMLPTDRKHEYKAEIPVEHIRPEWDLMYFIEVMDNKGNGRIYPDLEKQTPYAIVKRSSNR